MDYDDLNRWSKRAADWALDYHKGLGDRPVRPDIKPGDFRALIEGPAPEEPESQGWFGGLGLSWGFGDDEGDGEFWQDGQSSGGALSGRRESSGAAPQ